MDFEKVEKFYYIFGNFEEFFEKKALHKSPNFENFLRFVYKKTKGIGKRTWISKNIDVPPILWLISKGGNISARGHIKFNAILIVDLYLKGSGDLLYLLKIGIRTVRTFIWTKNSIFT